MTAVGKTGGQAATTAAGKTNGQAATTAAGKTSEEAAVTAAGKTGGRVPGRPGRHAKTVLISVIGLHLVAETALTPFLPQLFERLYGIHDPGATGLYIWICRIVGLAALPLWGLAARRWPLHKLVLAGLCGSAVFDLLLGLAPSYAAYIVLSTLVVTTNSALLLAYPAFIAQHDDSHGPDPDSADSDGRASDGRGSQGLSSQGREQTRLPGVCVLVAVFHLSVVVSTMVGAGVLALPDPRIGISAFAVLDTLLAVLTYRILGRRPDEKTDSSADVSVDSASMDGASVDSASVDGASVDGSSVLGSNTAAPTSGRRLTWFTMLAYAALIGVAFDFATNVARPFFTEFSGSLGSGAVGSAVLFFLPSVSALAVLPLARRCHDRLGDRLLPLALAVGAAGMAGTWLAGSAPGLAAGRLLYGVGLGLAQVAVELRMFRATGTKGPAFTVVETARSAGLLIAPLAATAAVSHDLALPLAVAAAVQIFAAALSLKRFRSTLPSTKASTKPSTKPSAVPKAASNAVSNAALNAAPNTVCDTTPTAAPNTLPDAAPNILSHAMPAARPTAVAKQAGPASAAEDTETRAYEPALTAAACPAYSEENR